MGRKPYLTLGQLAGLPPEDLKQEWARRYGAPAPNLSPNLLRLGVGYKLRGQKSGGIRMDSDATEACASNDLLALMADAMDAQRLVLASPELGLAQLAKREGRCRTQLTRLLRLSWMSPRIIDTIADGSQPKGLTRRALRICDMPIDWA